MKYAERVRIWTGQEFARLGRFQLRSGFYASIVKGVSPRDVKHPVHA